MNAYENVEIFEDTKRLCEKNEKLKASVAESVKGSEIDPRKARNCQLWIRSAFQMKQK